MLSRTAQTATFAFFFKQGGDNVSLKIAKYATKKGDLIDWRNPVLDEKATKNYVHLQPNEIAVLINFFEEKLGPMKLGLDKYIAVEDKQHAYVLQALAKDINAEEASDALKRMESLDLMPSHLRGAIIHRNRLKAIEDFKVKLTKNELEPAWQTWFEKNDWVLGNNHVAVLEDRRIDTENISDYLLKAEDGHLDLIEIKRPALHFWADARDHGNLVPHSDLTKALTQSTNYLFELEREMNLVKTQERLKGAPIAKPRALLIHGRSAAWADEHFRAQRLLNGSLSTVQILTYDQVLAKAERAVGNQMARSDSQQA